MKIWSLLSLLPLVCVLITVTVAPPRGPQDPPAAEGKPFRGNPLLESLVGRWKGNCRTWFQPGKLADESEITGEIVAVLQVCDYDGITVRVGKTKRPNFTRPDKKGSKLE